MEHSENSSYARAVAFHEQEGKHPFNHRTAYSYCYWHFHVQTALNVAWIQFAPSDQNSKCEQSSGIDTRFPSSKSTPGSLSFGADATGQCGSLLFAEAVDRQAEYVDEETNT